ncbi:MAG: BTAD domain-containing putative transcriptional regulator [Gemmatimonadales bacterium]
MNEGGPRGRRLALLAIIAWAGPRGVSRERVAAILWPDADEERARHALSQTVYTLRRDLGGDVIIAGADLRLNSAEISTDLEDFRQAIAAKRWTAAVAFYGGPFLDGFVLTEPGDFERWVAEEGAVLARDGLIAIEEAAREAGAARRSGEAVALWERATKIDPLNSRLAQGLVEALTARGDRSQALARAKSHAELLERELETTPDPSFLQAVARIRDGTLRQDVGPTDTERSRDPLATNPERTERRRDPHATTPEPTERSRDPHATTPERAVGPSPVAPARKHRLGLAVLGVALAGVVATAAVLVNDGSRVGGPSVLAVGRLRDLAAADSAPLAGVLSEMLTTSLGRLTDLEVVGTSRLLELMPPDADPNGQARLEAARQAGAREVLEGEVTQQGPGVYRFDLRRMDLATGVVRRGYTVTAGERYALIDSATRALAADLRLPAPPTSLADVSTRSPIAYRLYEEGLRAFYLLDPQAAHRLFNASLAEDSTFAMAAYYAWYSAALTGTTAPDRVATIAAIALDRSDRALDRDRLLIRTHILTQYRDPLAVAPAESLLARYPNDPEALIRVASALPPDTMVVALLERAIAIDSAAGSKSRCRLCEEFVALAAVHSLSDSIPAAERTVRRWIALRPEDEGALGTLPWLLYSMGRVAEGDRALARANELSKTPSDVAIRRIVRGVTVGESAGVLDACLTGLDVVSANRRQVQWYCVIALRTLGRYRDALALVREGRIPGAPRRISVDPMNLNTLPPAIIDLEMGRGGIAGSAFLRSAHEVYQAGSPRFESARASDRVWRMALAATAFSASGDLVRVEQLVDSIARWGSKTAWPRDRLLHHYARGLLLAGRGDLEAALTAHRAAISSWPLGFTRINYEIARTAMALGRPEEAIYPLQSALRGGIEGPQLYITRTELHELLAQAFAAAGRPDSAAAHYREVVEWWSGGDPSYTNRAEIARAWLARRGGPAPTP